MSAYTNGRWQPPAPPISIIESDLPPEMTLSERRRERARVQLANKPKRRWRLT